MINSNNLPHIIGIESKYESCSDGKYSTFYHYDIECQWLCDHLTIYNNNTNECNPISIYQQQQSLLKIINQNLYIMGIFHLHLTVFFSCFYLVTNCYTKKKPEIKLDTILLPKIEKRKSEYFYHDTENDDENDAENNEIDDNDNNNDNNNNMNDSNQNDGEDTNDSKSINQSNIALSVKSTRSNSIDSDNMMRNKDVLQSPTTQNEEIFRETTLAPLDNIPCDEKFNKMKSMMIEQARLDQFKLLDDLDAFRKNLEKEIEKEGIEQKEELHKKYLKDKEGVTDKEKLNELENEYNLNQTKIENESNDKKQTKINQYKLKIKHQLMDIKNNTKFKILGLSD